MCVAKEKHTFFYIAVNQPFSVFQYGFRKLNAITDFHLLCRCIIPMSRKTQRHTEEDTAVSHTEHWSHSYILIKKCNIVISESSEVQVVSDVLVLYLSATVVFKTHYIPTRAKMRLKKNVNHNLDSWIYSYTRAQRLKWFKEITWRYAVFLLRFEWKDQHHSCVWGKVQRYPAGC